MTTDTLIEVMSRGVELAGIAVIVLGAIVSTLRFLLHLWPTRGVPDAYEVYREGIGRAILLGLEFLVAADIVRTVAISPSFTSVGVLAAIILIRTFLAWTLELEITGRWPWEQRRTLGRPEEIPSSNLRRTPDLTGSEESRRTEVSRQGWAFGPVVLWSCVRRSPGGPAPGGRRSRGG
jgi:uncharacterized membrane protein